MTDIEITERLESLEEEVKQLRNKLDEVESIANQGCDCGNGV